MAAVGQHHQRPVPPPGSAPVATTQLEFHQAMRDFKTMFPEMDDDVIEAVLRANQGAVDATIDQLLAMSTDNENERLRTEMDATDNAEAPPGYSPITPPPTYQQAVPYSPVTSAVVAAAAAVASGGGGGAAGATSPEIKVATVSLTSAVVVAGSASSEQKTLVHKSPSLSNAECRGAVAAGAEAGMPLRVKRNWAPTHLGPLPCDFLRIMPKCGGRSSKQSRVRNGDDDDSALTAALCSEVIQQKMEENERQRKMGASTEDPELVQYLEDERIALFLQNEEFMQELRSNKDFLTTLERDARARNSNLNWASTYDSDEDESSSSDNEKPPADSSLGAFPHTKTLSTTGTTDESDAAFREKLKNMGKLSRSKFAQLARLFSRQKKRSAKQMYPYARLSESSMPSKDNLLLSEYDGGGSDSDDDSNQPQNEYHPIKNSASPIHEGSSDNVSSKAEKQ